MAQGCVKQVHAWETVNGKKLGLSHQMREKWEKEKKGGKLGGEKGKGRKGGRHLCSEDSIVNLSTNQNLDCTNEKNLLIFLSCQGQLF